MLGISFINWRVPIQVHKVPLQEAVYYSLLKLYLRNCFSRTVFVNTTIPQEHIRIYKSVEKKKELEPSGVAGSERSGVRKFRKRV